MCFERSRLAPNAKFRPNRRGYNAAIWNCRFQIAATPQLDSVEGLPLTVEAGAAETDEMAYETKAKGRRDDAEGLTGRWQGSRTGEALVTHGKVSIQRQ